jgi:hypothetical protein
MWHFYNLGGYEPGRGSGQASKSYGVIGVDVPSFQYVCYYLANWTAQWNPYDRNNQRVTGPWRPGAVGATWEPDVYRVFWLGVRPGDTFVIWVGTGWYYVQDSASGDLYIWVLASGSPTPSPSPSPTASPTPSLTPTPLPGCPAPASGRYWHYVGISQLSSVVGSGGLYSYYYGAVPAPRDRVCYSVEAADAQVVAPDPSRHWPPGTVSTYGVYEEHSSSPTLVLILEVGGGAPPPEVHVWVDA